MKKTVITLTLLAGISLNLFAQREIPMFFGLGLETGGYSRNVAYSPDGTKIAITFNKNEKIAIWDAVNGREIARLAGHDEYIQDIVFSPNGRQLASYKGEQIKIWDTSSGVLLHNIPQSNSVYSISFSPDGNNIAIAFMANVKIFNTAKGNEIMSFAAHRRIVTSVAYNPTGTQIFTASTDGTVKIWDARNGQNIRTIDGDTRFFNAVYSPNGQQIAAYEDNGKGVYAIRIINATSGQEIRSIPIKSRGYNLAYSPDGKSLLVNTRDDNDFIKVFDTDTGRELRSFNNGDRAVAFSPDGKKILATSASFEFKIGDTTYGVSYANILDATTGRTIGTIGYGPLNVGAKAFADLQIARFLNNTAEVSKNEAVLKFITDKGYATRQEIEAFYRDNVRAQIAGVVDAEFNKISFQLTNSNRTNSVILIRNPQNGQYILSYEKSNSNKTLTATSLDALLIEMRDGKDKADFNSADINTVKAQAALIPALIYEENKTTQLTSVKNILFDFYINPNRFNYEKLIQLYKIFFATDSSSETVSKVLEVMKTSFQEAFNSLNSRLAARVVDDYISSLLNGR